MISKVMYKIIVIIYILGLYQVTGQQSPCPDIFEYENIDNRWYGFITIPNPGYGTTKVTANVSFRGPILKGNGESLDLVKPLDVVVEDLKRGEDILYIFTLPVAQGVPTLSYIRLNDDEEICTGPKYSNRASWTFSKSFTFPVGGDTSGLPRIPTRSPPTPKPTPKPIVRPIPTPKPTLKPIVRPIPAPTPKPIQTPILRPLPTSTNNNNADWLSRTEFSSQCGQQNEPSDNTTTLIIGGWEVEPNEYPWMVALFKIIERRGSQYPEYICGASLVSTRYVLTAAHCTTDLDKILMQIGRHNITDLTEQYTVRLSERNRIIKHPDYKPDTGHADIALLEIDPVAFEKKIRPVCIWPFGTDLNSLEGTITGWGRVENGGSMATAPMQLIVRVVSQEECRNVPQLATIISAETFCAGGKARGPCHGDSGSGFYVLRNNRWYLRGIISTSLGTRYTCDINYFAVYADVSQYLDWIRKYLV